MTGRKLFMCMRWSLTPELSDIYGDINLCSMLVSVLPLCSSLFIFRFNPRLNV